MKLFKGKKITILLTKNEMTNDNEKRKNLLLNETTIN